MSFYLIFYVFDMIERELAAQYPIKQKQFNPYRISKEELGGKRVRSCFSIVPWTTHSNDYVNVLGGLRLFFFFFFEKLLQVLNLFIQESEEYIGL